MQKTQAIQTPLIDCPLLETRLKMLAVRDVVTGMKASKNPTQGRPGVLLRSLSMPPNRDTVHNELPYGD